LLNGTDIFTFRDSNGIASIHLALATLYRRAVAGTRFSKAGSRLCGAGDTTAAPQGRIEINLAAFESRIALALRGIADKTCSAPDATAIE
jgi:hypothetical protein